MLRLIRQHRSFFLATLLAAFLIRLCFVFYFPAITDDSHIYADLAKNWLQSGIYGETSGGHAGTILPTDARLPGFPAFLAAVFWIFGSDNFRAVMIMQVLIDLGTCLIIADLARRLASNQAARIAFALAALCPFLANYSAAVLTETLEVFFTALAFDCAATALNRMYSGCTRCTSKISSAWAATGAAVSACILLRPDGGILLAAIVLYICVFSICRNPKPELRYSQPQIERFRRSLLACSVVALFALLPLAPWTIRNFHTLHHFQPLAPRYANETDELVPRGFNRWVKTWIIDYVSVEEIYWNVPGDKIDPQKLPSRAFDSSEREATLESIADYNDLQDVSPELDSRFGELAADSVDAHPVRYYFVLPMLRIADMWLRPRTELLPADPRWWEFNDDRRHSLFAVGFGLLNLLYVAAALLAGIRRLSGIRWAGLLITFLLLRSAFLGTLENPEPRYTLEGYPAVIVLASAVLSKTLRSSHQT